MKGNGTSNTKFLRAFQGHCAKWHFAPVGLFLLQRKNIYSSHRLKWYQLSAVSSCMVGLCPPHVWSKMRVFWPSFFTSQPDCWRETGSLSQWCSAEKWVCGSLCYVSLIIELSPTTAAGHGLNAASSGGISSSKAHNFSPKRGRHICSLLLPSYISSRDMKYHPIRTVELWEKYPNTG